MEESKLAGDQPPSGQMSTFFKGGPPAEFGDDTSDSDGSSSHEGDWAYYKRKLQEEKRKHKEQAERVAKLAQLLRSYGIDLPSDPAGMSVALSSVAPLRATPSVTPSAAVTHRGPATVSMALRQGSEWFATAEGKIDFITKLLPFSPKTEIRFKNLVYHAQRREGKKDEPTVGDRCLAFWGIPFGIARRVFAGPAPLVRKIILDDISGSFKPGSITLLIGPPGSGKSSLLKMLAGRIHASSSHHIGGEVLYNGQKADPKNFDLPHVVALMEQADRHLATFTVQETLEFAFDCMDGGHHGSWIRPEELNTEQKQYLDFADQKKGIVRIVMSFMGLTNARNTIVGDDLHRGVSGGEKRRVTSAEMLVGSQNVALMDSISTGLDSSTTYDIVSTLKAAAQKLNKTIVIALLQPPPETYALFDNVCVMAGGSIIYHGAREGVLPYFERLGYRCPPRKDAADFIVELPTQEGVQHLMSGHDMKAMGMVDPPPRTVPEFATAWRATDLYKKEQEELARLDPEWKDYKWPPNQTREFAGTWSYHTRLCFRKHWTLFIRDKGYIRQRIITCVVMGLVIGSIFFNLGPNDANAKFGVLFFSMLFLVLAGFAQIPIAMKQREVFYKQRDQGFYPTTSDVMATILVQATLQIVETLILAPIVYWMVGLEADAGRFFIFLAILVSANLCLSQFMRLLSAIFPSFALAQAFGGISLVFLVIFCGYLVPQSIIPAAWIWVFWLNPLAWGFRAVVNNEFLGSSYKKICTVPAAGGGCAQNLGQATMGAYGFEQGTVWIWTGILFLLGAWLVYALVAVAFLHFLRYDASDNAPITGVKPDETFGVGPDGRSLVSEPVHPPVDMHSASVRRMSNVAEAAAEGAMPFTPVTFVFRNIWYSVPHPSGEGNLDLLKGVDGFCRPGTMTALMGSSGAGKTTLLDVLGGRKTGGEIKGDILLNGYPKDQATFNRVAGYVEQMDLHSPYCKVRETVEFSAAMRLGNETANKQQRKAFVADILAMLELDVIADRLIGSTETGGLSLEQKKRVTIAVELAANPSLIFLDEPTSGLDARAAAIVMNAIKKIAATGRTVICTIHQPSTYLFEMFDSLLLLKKGGETVYFGELGPHSSKMVEYLKSVRPDTPPVQPHVNPATWMLELIGAGTSGRVNPQIYADFYKSSLLKQGNDDNMNVLAEPRPELPELKFAHRYAATQAEQRKALLKRAFTMYWRAPQYNFTRWATASVIALVFASNFTGKGQATTEAEITSRLGLMYISTNFCGIVFFNQAIPFFDVERKVFYREQAASMYSAAPYAMGFGLAEIPYTFFGTAVYVNIFYWMAQYETDAAKFFWFWLFFALYVFFMTYLGLFFMAAVPNAKVASTLGSVLNSLFSCFAGFLISPGLLPTFWIFAYWLCPTHYAIEGMATTQWHGDSTLIQTRTGALQTAEDYVTDFFGGDYLYTHRGYDIMALLIFIAVVRIGFFLAVKYIRHINR